MSIIETNIKLKALYLDKWASLCDQLMQSINADYTNPFLIQVSEDWEKANLKVMIFGQETKGWAKDLKLGSEGVDSLISIYNNFFILKGYLKPRVNHAGKNIRIWRFWSNAGFQFFEKNLRLFENSSAFVWNNIVKIGRNNSQVGVCVQTNLIERQYFSVLHEEVLLTKPNIFLFLTGPDRDHDIRFNFPNFKYIRIDNSLSNDDLVALDLGLDWPHVAIRTYHPAARNKGVKFKHLRATALEYIWKSISFQS